MPGPGGGSRGGGGGRGFGGGGSFGGGGRGFGGGGPRGFGGPHHYGPRYHGGWFFGPRYYGGGGCLGGMMAMLIAPIIIILFAGLLLLSVFSSAFNTVVNGGETAYDENVFQDYADEQYAAEFGLETDYEDHILLVFLVEDEEYYDYNYIAWVGDHVDLKINNMFGSNNSELGRAISASAINSQSYKYSLDSGIASVVQTMQGHIESLGLGSSLTCQSEEGKVRSHLTNKTELDVTESTVNNALVAFTESTGITIVVVVDDIDEVLPKNIDIFSLLVAIILIVVAIVLIVKAVKSRKKKDEDDGSYKGSSSKEKINFDNDF